MHLYYPVYGVGKRLKNFLTLCFDLVFRYPERSPKRKRWHGAYQHVAPSAQSHQILWIVPTTLGDWDKMMHLASRLVTTSLADVMISF